ncbi:MAG: hypothetical protein IT379_30010 [Deltaproteobacteria bacterium]|nr:hypothetical protein [Deltaproteobacteria bacterium]
MDDLGRLAAELDDVARVLGLRGAEDACGMHSVDAREGGRPQMQHDAMNAARHNARS